MAEATTTPESFASARERIIPGSLDISYDTYLANYLGGKLRDRLGEEEYALKRSVYYSDNESYERLQKLAMAIFGQDLEDTAKYFKPQIVGAMINNLETELFNEQNKPIKDQDPAKIDYLVNFVKHLRNGDIPYSRELDTQTKQEESPEKTIIQIREHLEEGLPGELADKMVGGSLTADMHRRGQGEWHVASEQASSVEDSSK